MKYFSVLCVLMLAIIVMVSSDDEMKSEYCKDEFKQKLMSEAKNKCFNLKCTQDNKRFTKIGCSENRCPGEVLRDEGEPGAPYPRCCSQPVCKED